MLIGKAGSLVAMKEVWVDLSIQLAQNGLQSGRSGLRGAAAAGLRHRTQNCQKDSAIVVEQCCSKAPAHLLKLQAVVISVAESC